MLDIDQRMVLGLIFLIILQLGLNIFATYRWIVQKKHHPSESKKWWLFIIWFVNLFGAIAFLIIGDVSRTERDNNDSWD